MGEATVTIVTPNFNHADLLVKSIESVLAQTRKPDQYIILDDCSTDNSAEILDRYTTLHPWIETIRLSQNQGVVKSVQQLLSASTSTYFFSLAADDFIAPLFIETSMKQLVAHPEAALSSSMSLYISPENRPRGIFPSPVPLGKPDFLSPEKVSAALLKYGPWFMGNATIYHRQRLLDAGGFRPELRSFTDGFVSHVLALQHGCIFIPEPLAVWRESIYGESATTNRDIADFDRVISTSKTLMQGEFAALFPQKYIAQWERRRACWSGLSILSVAAKAYKDADIALKENLAEHDLKSGIILGLSSKLSTLSLLTAKASLVFSSSSWPATPLMARWVAHNLKHLVGQKNRHSPKENS